MKPSRLEDNLKNFIKVTQSSFEQVTKNHEILSRNHDASIKNLETQIGQLSKKIVALPSSSAGFTGNTVDNPKNETCKVEEFFFWVVTSKEEDEKVKEDKIEEKEREIEKEEVK